MSKNVSHDFLDLRVPVWITDLQFLNKQETTKLVVGTKYHQVRQFFLLHHEIIQSLTTKFFDLHRFEYMILKLNADQCLILTLEIIQLYR